LEFAYRSVEVKVGIETTAAVVTLISAYLVYGRLTASELRSELLLFSGIAALSAASVGSLVALTLSGETEEGTAFWVPLAMRLLAYATLAAAAILPERRLRQPAAARRKAAWAALAAVAAVASIAVASPELSTGIDPTVSPEDSNRALIAGSPGLLAVQAVILLALIGGAVGFARQAERRNDQFLAWIAVAVGLAAFGRVNYILFPSNFTQWVYVGDGFRLAAYLTMLAGVLAQLGVYQRAAVSAAVLDERRRIARDLHDGLAQDLAFISTHGRRLAETDARAETLVAAADQALADSRGAIAALNRPVEEPLAASLGSMASMLADRAEVRVLLDLDPAADVAPPTRDALLRIVAEAISNAIRHGRASELTVRLRSQGSLFISVEDDGVGLDPEDASGVGFGLISMRERAELLGASLSIRSRPQGGTAVEVEIA
jgi:signal transduction histidine kinase